MASPSHSSPANTRQAPSITTGIPPTVGIIGGGQLSQMLCLAATQLGLRTATVERSASCPAATVSGRHLVGDWNDPEVLRQLAKHSDVLTLENEFVAAESLQILESENIFIRPGSICLRTIQDKLVQKQTLKAAALPTPLFRDTPDQAALEAAGVEFGYPFVLKRRRNGYDGKGNFTLHSADDLRAAWDHLDGDQHGLFAEAFCPFKAEVAVMVCRSINGEGAVYPVVETIQKNHICHVVKAPGAFSPEAQQKALAIAQQAVATVDGLGAIGVELFLTEDDEIVINELAPRVHNSGHYTLEACYTSQFENHLRAILGLPLGDTSLLKPAAVMINILGDGPGGAFPGGVEQALATKGVHFHLYGKDKSQTGRKMGHLTVLGDDMDKTLRTAHDAASSISFVTR